MRNTMLRRIVSLAAVMALMLLQAVPVSGNNTGVLFKGAAQYASSGMVNCFPDKGQWGVESEKAFYIKYDSDSGNEYKPVDGDSDFTYAWLLPLEGMETQIDKGLQYKIDFDVFGHILDFDYARVNVDFWVPVGEGITAFVTDQTLFEDVDGWKHRSFAGYVPDDATYMRVRFGSKKATGSLSDSDAAIFYRNIEVYLVDDMPPTPTGIEYGTRYELGTTELRTTKDYYGVGTDVYWDVEFNEAVFVNDPGYLEYARGLNENGRKNLASSVSYEYPDDNTVVLHVLNNNGASTEQQFGKLTLQFKYRNSDGSDHTGYATVVDRSLYNPDTYGNDYSKQIKFKYTVRPGDDFRAEDIYEMELVGGIITDNAYNPMPAEYRKITFDSNTGTGINTIYRKYVQNFNVETTAPVLLEINGRTPDGLIEQNTQLPLYLKFSEPVYLTMSDGEFSQNNIDKYEFNRLSYEGHLHAGQYSIDVNSKYVDSVGNESSSYGAPKAYYSSGNGTTMLKFDYYVHENKFDPLEITGSEIKRSDVSCGEIYVMDAAGNTAPLIQQNNVKLSDGKYYVADAEPPEISVQTLKAEAGKGGFYLKIDVADKGEGVDYDSLRFGFGYVDLVANTLWNNVKPLVPGKLYHSEELKQLFGIDTGKSDNFRVLVDARDKKGNDHFSSKYGAGWYSEINIDTAAPVLDHCYVDNGKYSSLLGSFTAVFRDGTSGESNSGMGSAPNIKYKWVSSGFNPDTEDWQTPARTYSAGAGYYYAEGPRPSGYIYGDADLYLKAVDLAGNETLHYVPKALLYSNMVYMNDRLDFDFQTWSEGHVYACKVYRFDRSNSGVYKDMKGLWYCLTAEGTIPEFSETSGLWKYKDGDTVESSGYDANPRERNGYYFMHVIAVDNDGKPLGAATSPTMLLFDFKEPVITAEAEKQQDGSWKLKPYALHDRIWREDIKLQYSFNYTYDWKELPENGEILVGRELQNPNAWVLIRAASSSGGYYNPVAFGPYSNIVRKIAAPYINYYKGSRYTNEDFVQLLIGTEAEEFSYSLDGTGWSSWLPMKVDKVISGYNFKAPCVPLPDKEGEITFYTRYRKAAGEESPVVKSMVVRDVTPPTGEVDIQSYNNSTYFYTAAPRALKDNLCSSGEIEVLGEKSVIIARGESYYFVIRDAAGNKGELKAYVVPETVITVPDNVKEDDGDDDPPPIPDTTAPVITINPNGAAHQSLSVSPTITVNDDSSIASIEYVFSTNADSETVTGWASTVNGAGVTLSGVDGLYYLHVRAVDAAANTAVQRSEAYNMVSEFTEPSVVFSGELDGEMTAFIVSPSPITVTEAVYGGLTRDNPGYAFDFEYGDGTPGSITGEFDGWTDGIPDFIGTVRISPDNRATAGEVTVNVSAPKDLDFGMQDKYEDYDGELEFRIGEHGDEALNDRLVYDYGKPEECGSIRILEGFIGTWNYDSSGYDITEDLGGEIYTEELSGNVNVHIFSAEITVNSNGLVIYHVDDGKYTIQIGHIVEDEALVDNVTVARAEGSRLWAYAPWPLFASSNRYAAYSGMLKVYESLSGADLTPPLGQVSYTAADPKKGPVVANLRLADNSGGKVTIVNNSGSSSHTFDTNGQFVFRFVDEAGNEGRALAEVGTIASMPSGVEVSYSTKHPTKDKVKVTMTPAAGVTLKSGDMPAALENGSYSFEAADNGQWKFKFINEGGEETEVTADIENIDRTPPKLRLEYIRDNFNKTFTVLVRSDEPIWAARGSSLIHVFKENGQNTLKAVDEAGNEASIAAAVDNIDALGTCRSNIDVRMNYSTQEPTNKPVKIILSSDRAFTVLNNGGRTEKEIVKSGRYQFIIMDSAGLVKTVEAKVKNIDTEAPVITLGYPDITEVVAGEPIDLMNFTAVDNFEGDVKAKVKVEGNVNTRQPGTYQATYTVTDSCGNTAVKTLAVKVLGSDEQIVTVNGIKHESEALLLSTNKLQVAARGFSGQVSIKWTKGYETVAFFKDYGNEAASGIVPLNETGWYSLYISDAERNSRLIHVYISDLGGGQQ